MEVSNVEDVYDFFRNVLNILPTREQKHYIKFIHENDHSTYYKSDRQTGETVAINAYMLWLLEMARISQEKITIVMAEKWLSGIYENNLKEIILNSKLKLKYKRNLSSMVFENGSKIIHTTDTTYLFGHNIDYLYLNGIREGFETLRINRKIMRTI